MAGKGDRWRKSDLDKYRKNYDAIFGKKYPEWICRPCGITHGRSPSDERVSTFHIDTCGICGEITACTEPRDYGHLKEGWDK